MKKLILIFTLILSLWSCAGQVPGIGGMVTPSQQTSDFLAVKNGYIYNFYAVDHSTTGTYISNFDWHVPSDSDFDLLVSNLGGSNVAGGKLKEVGFLYWNEPNVGATNESGFNAKGSGNSSGGDFYSMYNAAQYRTTNSYTSTYAGGYQLSYSHAKVGSFKPPYTKPKTQGMSIRLVKNFTDLSHGETGTYVGNDGKVYRTICIVNQEWIADNLCETKYRDGTTIPVISDPVEWTLSTSGARTVYNNDENNM